MATNSVSLHRVLTAAPEKVFRAFSDTTAFASWLPPYGYLCVAQQMDFKVGGNYKMTFTNFSTGKEMAFGGEYLEIKPNEFLKYSDKFDDPNLPGEMMTTVTFNKVSVGTEIKITQEGIPSAIPIEMCYLGWQESLEKLKKLVDKAVARQIVAREIHRALVNVLQSCSSP